MIEKRTVFVLGAGASCPYGYPSGAQLRKQICLDEHDYLSYLNRAYPDASPRHEKLESIRSFASAFFRSDTESIDLFLARNRDLVPMGKYIIAFQILNAEYKSRFREQAVEGQDWYSYLFRRLTQAVVSEEELSGLPWEMVAFITFNYDRSLEHFLYEGVRYSFKKLPEHEVFRLLKSIGIVHVYGQTAPLKWQDPNEGVDYRPQISESLLRTAAKNIKTIYEEKESPELAEAHKLIESAQRIIFLGFGYRPENMDVLNLPDLIRGGCEIRGTAFNMIEEEVKRIPDTMLLRMRGDGSSYSGSYDTRIEPCDCLMLLRKYL